MVDVKELYKTDIDDDYWFGISNYTPMIEAFGEVVVREDDDDYQGDTFVILKNEGKFGYLSFGWGSCSGCDALQACENIEEVQVLCNELESSIQWFDSENEVYEWFSSHDWEGDWLTDTKRTFIQKVLNYFE